jgi:hypothetical protein
MAMFLKVGDDFGFEGRALLFGAVQYLPPHVNSTGAVANARASLARRIRFSAFS